MAGKAVAKGVAKKSVGKKSVSKSSKKGGEKVSPLLLDTFVGDDEGNKQQKKIINGVKTGSRQLHAVMGLKACANAGVKDGLAVEKLNVLMETGGGGGGSGVPYVRWYGENKKKEEYTAYKKEGGDLTWQKWAKEQFDELDDEEKVTYGAKIEGVVEEEVDDTVEEEEGLEVDDADVEAIEEEEAPAPKKKAGAKPAAKKAAAKPPAKKPAAKKAAAPAKKSGAKPPTGSASKQTVRKSLNKAK